MGASIFESLVGQITSVGREWHVERVQSQALANKEHVGQSLSQIPMPEKVKAVSCIVISAGPSLHRRDSIVRIRDSQYRGAIVAVDGAYLACLRHGLIPDYVVTLDPHPTRVVRLFGDPEFDQFPADKDDYFDRQDLDVELRNNTAIHNQRNIDLVNENGSKSRLIASTTIAPNVVRRIQEACFDIYWWNPLMDNPHEVGSLTRTLHEINGLPSMNTGGTVGTAAWLFAASRLHVRRIGLVGMDYGYYNETPKEMTQTYLELKEFLASSDISGCFPDVHNPYDGETYFTDPTYEWYRRNFFDLYNVYLRKDMGVTVNCTEGGALFSENLDCISLDKFLGESA